MSMIHIAGVDQKGCKFDVKTTSEKVVAETLKRFKNYIKVYETWPDQKPLSCV